MIGFTRWLATGVLLAALVPAAQVAAQEIGPPAFGAGAGLAAGADGTSAASSRPATGRLPAEEPRSQATGGAAPAPQSPAGTADEEEDDEDEILDPAQPDFSLINLPTALRVPRHRSAFRVTHRFTRPLGAGDFGDLAEDLFGFDAGAQIGLEYRFGLFRATQAGLYRTSDRTIQFFFEREVLRQREAMPIGLTALLTAEGTNNFRDSYSPAIGAILSRTFGDAGAVYLEPIWVNNTNPLPSELADDNDTAMVGVGARVRVRPTVYVVAEVTPRLTGYKGGRGNTTPVAFGVEKRAGGHLFQLNFSDSIGTTFAQLARGGTKGPEGRDWYIGFNIARKFF